MSHYNRDTAANRDALFGPSSKSSSSAGGPKHKREAAANRDALFGGAAVKTSSGASRPSSGAPSRTTSTSAPSAATSRPTSSINNNNSESTAKGYSFTAKKGPVTSVLSGAAKVDKLKEAEEYREKAKKAMQRGVFARPDPIAAGMFYKRAADAYQQCGENRLERLHRIASADCQMGQGAYATAAAEYTRAADLVKVSEETTERKRLEGCKLHSDAANAYRQMGEMGKAADSMVQSAFALLWQDNSTLIHKPALQAIEEAVEAHVPDVLNRYARYRQTGTSAFIDPDKDIPDAEVMALAKNHMVKKAYAHEPLQEAVYVLVRYGEYQSALYAAGAATAVLESEGIATLTLSRSYVAETILLLAMGDPVAARQAFLDYHVQKDFYLTSRECKLAEELFTAILSRDMDALEEARSPSGSNRAALSNLHESLRTLVTQLRISGVARRQVASMTTRRTTKTVVDDELDKELGLPVAPVKQQIAATSTSKQPMAVTSTTNQPIAATSTITKEPPTKEVDTHESDTEESDGPKSVDDSDSEDEPDEGMKAGALQAELDALGLESDEDDGTDDDDDIDLR